MSSKKPPEEKIANVAPFGLRMLTPLKERVQASAEANNRSMNAEIVHLLEFALWEQDEAKRRYNLHKVDPKSMDVVEIVRAEISKLQKMVETLAEDRRGVK